MNKGGFSWKTFFGVTRAKRKLSRSIGIPLTKSGRQRKVGKMILNGLGGKSKGSGCSVLLFFYLVMLLSFFLVIVF